MLFCVLKLDTVQIQVFLAKETLFSRWVHGVQVAEFVGFHKIKILTGEENTIEYSYARDMFIK